MKTVEGLRAKALLLVCRSIMRREYFEPNVKCKGPLIKDKMEQLGNTAWDICETMTDIEEFIDNPSNKIDFVDNWKLCDSYGMLDEELKKLIAFIKSDEV